MLPFDPLQIEVDTSGKSPAYFHHRSNNPSPRRETGGGLSHWARYDRHCDPNNSLPSALNQATAANRIGNKPTPTLPNPGARRRHQGTEPGAMLPRHRAPEVFRLQTHPGPQGASNAPARCGRAL